MMMNFSDYRIHKVRNLSPQEVSALPRSDSKRPHCAGCNGVIARKDGTYSVKGGVPRIVSQLGEAYFHTACLPAEHNWQDLFVHGVRATATGAMEGIRRHPYITAAACLAIAGFVGYAYASSEVFERICFRPMGQAIAYCADVMKSSDLTKAMYEKYYGVNQWVHSGDFAKKTYETVSQGVTDGTVTQFIHKKFRQYFVQNPFEKFFG